MKKILERRLTRFHRVIADNNGLVIERMPVAGREEKVRLAYGQYRIYIFSRGNYVGMAYEIYLWGPGILIQFDDMHYEYYIGIGAQL